jgi:2-keto-4-pentenoate hydratase/2-oxohepta-3-ene-1,7-dioic acid hydratase in catechol pathway
MKLVRFDDHRTGLLVDGDPPRVLDVAASLDAFGADEREGGAILSSLFAAAGGVVSWVPAIERWDDARAPLRRLIDWGAKADGAVTLPLDGLRLRPPLPSPQGRIFALGTNFASHVAQASAAIGADESLAAQLAQRPPGGFYVIPGTVIGPGDEFAAPPGAVKIDFEVEVAVVLAAAGRGVPADAFRIWGHTGWNDLSIRDPHLGVGLADLDKGTLSWALQKNWDGANACGAYMVVDEGADLADLHLESRVNGELRQNGSTSEMIRSFAEVASYLSQFLRLEPGDVLTSGTPAGTAIEQGIDGPFLQPGDVVECEVEGAGVLRNRMAG